MTDKQIIIDGIDVSGCWYIDRDNAWCDLCMTSCVKGTKHCYYKQLKRKEQECEELKTKLINWLGKEGLRQSEKEFYEQQLEAYKMEAKEGKEINAELKAENDLFRTCHDNEQAKRRKYEQTLAEIKEVVKEQLPTVNYNFAKSMHPEMFNCYEQILQKISEVEDV